MSAGPADLPHLGAHIRDGHECDAIGEGTIPLGRDDRTDVPTELVWHLGGANSRYRYGENQAREFEAVDQTAPAPGIGRIVVVGVGVGTGTTINACYGILLS